MDKLKVLTIVGTRPEIIKMSRVMAELEKFVEHVLVHTGQNYDYELNEIFFENLGVKKPDYFLDVAGKNVAYTISNIIVIENVCSSAIVQFMDSRRRFPDFIRGSVFCRSRVV